MNELLKNKYVKMGVVALVIALVIVVVYFVLRKIKSGVKEAQLIAEANSEVDITKTNFTEQQYQTFAAKLYRAMKGAGTDEDAIYAVFSELESRSDLMKVMAAFGVKDGMTLNEWIADDCNQSEIDRINSILAIKGISFSF